MLISPSLKSQQILNGNFENIIKTSNPTAVYYDQFYPDTFPYVPYIFKRDGRPYKYNGTYIGDTNTRLVLSSNKQSQFRNHPNPLDTSIYIAAFFRDSSDMHPGITRLHIATLSLQLSANLIKGKTYHLRYIVGIDSLLVGVGWWNSIFKIGLSNNHSEFGDSIGITPPPERTYNWQTMDVFFTAPNNGSFITLEFLKLNDHSQYFDAFQSNNGYKFWNLNSYSYFDNFELVCSSYIGNDTMLCNSDSLILRTNQPNKKYLWSTGQQTENITISNSGNYWVKVDEDGCISSDTIKVIFDFVKKNFLGNDTILCQSNVFALAPGIIGSYLWSTGSKSMQLPINQSGSYSVAINNGTCIHKDTIQIDMELKEIPDFPISYKLCKDSSITIKTLRKNTNWYDKVGNLLNSGFSFNFKDSNSSVLYVTTGQLCRYVDSLYFTITDCSLPVFDSIIIPNAFSPNGDGVNDYFNPTIKGYNRKQMQVYNRWGELIFETNDETKGWDGTYKTNFVQQDVYLVLIKLQSKTTQDTTKPVKYWKGMLQVIR
ncbi:MAG: gliding motility-associated C-terminal domain-containing protein [bacterium]|nr:gliding motility-associated C-terminal domain-containing protein [bacterium]